jgi:serine/threonine-protein kinase
VLGTLAYMAPEQAQGRGIDQRSDVFGLGAILCEILTGQPPYVGATSREIYRRAERADLAEALARLDGCGADPALVRLAQACLAADPAGRPADAGEVAGQVTAYLASVQGRLRAAEVAAAAAEAKAAEEHKARAAAQARVAAERRARRLTVALAAAVLLTALLGGGGWWWLEAERDARQQKVDRDIHQALEKATALRLQASRPGPDAARRAAQAREHVQRAQALAASGDCGPGLAQQVRQLAAAFEAEDKDRRLLDALEDARLATAETDVQHSRFRLERAIPLYREALRAWGAQVRAAVALKDPAQRRAKLEELAGQADVQGLPVLALTSLARRLDTMEAGASAVALLRRAQAQHLGDFWVNHELGMALWRLQSAPDEAVRYLTAAVALRQASPGAHLNLGIALTAKGDLDGAIAQYRRAIALDSKYAKAHTNLGKALNAKGDRDGAIACFRRAIAVDPKEAMAHNNLGALLYGKGDVAGAITKYKEAIAVDPKLAEPHNNLGALFYKKGDLVGAIAAYRQAAAVDPRNAKVHSNLADALRAKGDLDGAIAAYRRAVALDPKDAQAHTNLGFALYAKGDLDEAIAAYRRAIAIDPKLAPAHYNLGVALGRKRGDLDGAIACFRRAIAIDPKLAKAHSNLGLARFGKGDMAGAITA